MKCPTCKIDTKIIDTREVAKGAEVRRRHNCLQCGLRFTTFEAIEGALERRLSIALNSLSMISKEIENGRKSSGAVLAESAIQKVKAM